MSMTNLRNINLICSKKFLQACLRIFNEIIHNHSHRPDVIIVVLIRGMQEESTVEGKGNNITEAESGVMTSLKIESGPLAREYNR